MLANEISDTIVLVWSHTVARISLLLIIFTSLLFSIFFSLLASVIILSSYLLGCIVSFCLIKYKFEVAFCLQRLTNFYYGHKTPKKKSERGCDICEDEHCNRHQKTHIKEPWKDLYITKELNQSIENFYNKILDNFINCWYKNFTDDESFSNELRVSFRYATSMIINRYENIDVGRLIANKLLPCALQHIHECMQIKEDLQNKTTEPIIKQFGKNLHVAVTSHKNELMYLRHLVNCMLPYVLPKTHLECKNFHLFIKELIAGWVLLPVMDIIADPNIINFLINLGMQKRNPSKLYYNQMKVPYLHNFAKIETKRAALWQDLNKVLKSPEMFYAFMQFLKEDGPVNILQFCLDVDEFNKKLLTPDLSTKDLDDLHVDAMHLYRAYLSPESPNFIRCPKDISVSIEHLLRGGSQNVSKLRTSAPLYKAYEYAFGILENEWLPVFYHSDEFYNVICGPRIASSYHRTTSVRHKRHAELSNQGAVSKISSGFSRMKNVLRTQPIDGAVYPAESHSYETDSSIFIERNIYRDLSAWRVSINLVEQSPGPKTMCVFHLNIKRIDYCSENERFWTVQRHDQDFHTLKIKLVEFHGENEICDSPLPSRRLTTPLETRKQKYEEFIQKLLQKPSLRGSDLLYTFLTTKQNFSLLADTSMPIVSDLGNIYQSVAHKLRKEKGQHLDTFMSTFLVSTETGQSKISKFESPDVGEEADSGIVMEGTPQLKKRNLKNSMYGNNFNISCSDIPEFTSNFFSPHDFIQCTLYALKHIFKAPYGILKLFSTICNIAYQAIDCLARLYIERHLRTLLSQHTLAHLITLLQDVIFYQRHQPTELELQERKQIAFKNIAKIHRSVFTVMGLDVNTGLTTVLQILQHPQLNKQLAYSLLDIVLIEFYPDLNTKFD